MYFGVFWRYKKSFLDCIFWVGITLLLENILSKYQYSELNSTELLIQKTKKDFLAFLVHIPTAYFNSKILYKIVFNFVFYSNLGI